MGPAFQDATRALVRQLDPVGDLIPLTSLIDDARFQPFCLVRRKRKGTLFWGMQYIKTDFSLRDVLEPGPKLPEPRRDSKITIQGRSDGGVTAGVKTAAVGLPVNISVTCGSKCQNSMEIQMLSIVNDLENLKKRKLKRPEPSFLQKLRERGENLYVVTEAVETLKEATLERGGKAGGGISIPLLTAVGLKGSFSFNTTINLPLGAILAFRLKQLVIGENSWDIPPFKDKKLKTFSLKGPSTPRLLSRPEPASKEHTGFRTLQAEVEEELQALKSLAPQQRSALLKELLALLGQRSALRDLEEAVDQALDLDEPMAPGVLGGPKDKVLMWLQETSGKINSMIAGSILYLLGALQEMSEEQQQLLAMSVEKGILSRQMMLMETILEQNFLREEEGPFRLHCELLGGFWGEELKVTQALVGLCHLDIQGDGPLYTWEPNALPPLCALYAALSIFRVLANSTWLSSHFVHQGSPALARPGLGQTEWDLGMGLGERVKMKRSFGSKLPLEAELQNLHLQPSLLSKELEALSHGEGSVITDKEENVSSINHEVGKSSNDYFSHISRGSGRTGVLRGAGLRAPALADRGSFSGFGLGFGSSLPTHSSLMGREMGSGRLGVRTANALNFDAEFDIIQDEHQRLLNQEFEDILGSKADLGIWGETSKFFRE